MAIDYGLKRTGLAITDPEQLIATGLASVATIELMDYMAQYLKHHEVERFVLGEPRRMDNSASGPGPQLAALVKSLESTFGLPVDRMDERFTSKIAARSLVESGVKKSGRRDKGLVDLVSATLILQSYLESRNRKS